MKQLIFNIRIWWHFIPHSPLYPVSLEWSNHLDKLIESGETIKIIDECHASFGNLTLWIANHPYASFSTQVRQNNIEYKFMPTKKVGYKLHLLLKSAFTKNAIEAKRNILNSI